MREKVRTE